LLRFVLHRIAVVVPSLFGLLVLTFVLIHLVPADPAAILAGDNATPEQMQVIRHRFGLDQPLPIQFLTYLNHAVHLDFGESAYSRRPVAQDIAQRLPATLELVFVSLLIATLVGIPLGTIAATHHNRLPDFAVRVATVAATAVAAFWLAIMLQLLFAMMLHWLPLRGRLGDDIAPPAAITRFYLIDSLLTLRFDAFADALRHIALPALTLSLGSIATIARFTRAGMLEVLQKDFVLYTRAVGVTRRRLVWIYVLRNAVSAAVTQIGLLFGSLIAGGVVVESIFDWPGIGSYAVSSILSADDKAVLAVTLVIGLIYCIVNTVVDVVLGLIDPRMREQG
jgi:peptide/nickel transport system permease protein